MDSSRRGMDSSCSDVDSTRSDTDLTWRGMDSTRRDMDLSCSDTDSTWRGMDSTHSDMDSSCSDVDSTRSDMDLNRSDIDSTRRGLVSTWCGMDSNWTQANSSCANSNLSCLPIRQFLFTFVLSQIVMKYLFIVLTTLTLSLNAQIITTVAGNGTAGYSGDGGQATNAELNTPDGITIDAIGNIYISDRANNRVRKISTAGIISTIAGNGIAGYLGDGGQASTAELSNPIGLAFDAFGNLFIADTYNNCVRKINTLGIISTIAGRDSSGIGVAGYTGDGGQATAAELNGPNWISL